MSSYNISNVRLKPISGCLLVGNHFIMVDVPQAAYITLQLVWQRFLRTLLCLGGPRVLPSYRRSILSSDFRNLYLFYDMGAIQYHRTIPLLHKTFKHLPFFYSQNTFKNWRFSSLFFYSQSPRVLLISFFAAIAFLNFLCTQPSVRSACKKKPNLFHHAKTKCPILQIFKRSLKYFKLIFQFYHNHTHIRLQIDSRSSIYIHTSFALFVTRGFTKSKFRFQFCEKIWGFFFTKHGDEIKLRNLTFWSYCRLFNKVLTILDGLMYEVD